MAHTVTNNKTNQEAHTMTTYGQDGTSLISTRAIEILRGRVNAPKDCLYKVMRTSKWAVDITFFNGLELFAKFRVNVRKNALDRLV